ncbi:hypothetical protein DFJ74DRAFT_665466 [Hyaloraphidium curvatum]|nr:hypothetical protein DFJ74DRAFT_665466 [Hyaloraphidium curvatum]
MAPASAIPHHVPRAPNGGLAGTDPKLFYDPLDDRRPLLDLAFPTEVEVDEFHTATELHYPEGTRDEDLRRFDVTAIGTGMGGITVAMFAQWRLRNVNLKIFEKNAKPTGTWYENKYPGCRCDLTAPYYIWRWEPNPLWSAEYVESDEIESYFSRMIKKYNVDAFTHYSTEVVSATWSDDRQAWRLEVRGPDGAVRTEWTHFLINSHGVLNRPKIPTWPGEEEFVAAGGKVMHTARFDRSVPLEGKRVAVIGNGSSGIQTIGTIFKKVAELHSYQRTPTWISNQLGGIDKIDVHKYSPREKELFSDRQYAHDFVRWNFRQMDRSYNMFRIGSRESRVAESLARKLLDKLVRDPKLRAELTPTFPVGCRRPTPHEFYLEALQDPRTTIVKGPIERFTARGIVAGGVERPCDVIIKATGFNVDYKPSFPVTGRGGKTLAQVWADYPFSYKSVMSSGFPNFLHVMGPNAPVAAQSIHSLEEQQINFAFQLIQKMQMTDIVSVDPKRDVEKAWNDRIQQELQGTIWQLDCGGWYKHPSGVLVSHYPGYSLAYMDEIRSPDYSELTLTRLSDMADPKLNAIPEPAFGADVEKVAAMGPPREPDFELAKRWGKHRFDQNTRASQLEEVVFGHKL